MAGNHHESKHYTNIINNKDRTRLESWRENVGPSYTKGELAMYASSWQTPITRALSRPCTRSAEQRQRYTRSPMSTAVRLQSALRASKYAVLQQQ